MQYSSTWNAAVAKKWLVNKRRKAARLVLSASFSSAVNCSRDVLADVLLKRVSEKGVNLLSALINASRPVAGRNSKG